MLHINPAKSFKLNLESLPADKSLSHRALLFALLSDKPCFVENLLMGQDCLSTLTIAKSLGLKVQKLSHDTLKLTPPKKFLHFSEPKKVLHCHNSGTTMRLFSGLLSTSQPVRQHFILTGDASLSARPMGRVIAPLVKMGAQIRARAHHTLAPLSILSAPLRGINYTSPIASAQLKSAILLATLNAKTPSTFSEPHLSRDHTERMLKTLGANIHISPQVITLEPLSKPLESFSWRIPADPSSAFYFALATMLVPQSAVLLKNVLLNPTRIEAFRVLEKMGAHIAFVPAQESSIESVGDIYVEHRALKAIHIRENIASLIDELPALAVAMAVAKGTSVVKNARELRVKESDRITTTLTNLTKMGVECQAHEDGFSITGGDLTSPKESLESFGDHRIALSFAVALLACGGRLKNTACMGISFPTFKEILGRITPLKEIYASENG
ncbi:3-phosphoshikimate 1-carboxyvinyltransferase [Helicobacter baculiformis]|uniref:3-phosphoshikimate 1-carboxyvinyltransferase n=1 Tax=Helicobacter baculiformis TaxID=427351 RepID=A0ABV7ZFV0_9HELI|nr:3-phosphoshikimate 1-carboxyvinyltransferase [Helicobacter baculiformis]